MSKQKKFSKIADKTFQDKPDEKTARLKNVKTANSQADTVTITFRVEKSKRHKIRQLAAKRDMKLVDYLDFLISLDENSRLYDD